MISGTVNENWEAVVPLIVVGQEGRAIEVEAIIDTGFNGCLTLPADILAELQLTWLCRENGILADGRVDSFDVFSAELIWNGQRRMIDVEEVESTPLIGMSLLQRHSLRVDVVPQGTVTISSHLISSLP